MWRTAKWMLATLAMLVAGEASAIQYIYAVRFTDKANTPYSVSAPLAFLSQRSLDRRAAQSISLDSSDLPVNPAYMQQVQHLTAGSISGSSRWLNLCVLAVHAPVDIAALRGLPFVKSTELIGYIRDTVVATAADAFQVQPAKRTTGSPTHYGNTWTQTDLVHGDPLHDAGLNGSGKLIAVLDAGFIDADTHPGFSDMWSSGRVADKRNFVLGNDAVFGSDNHGTRALSTIAGYVPGTYVGSAPMASYALYVTEDGTSETPVEMYNILLASERADSAGVDIITTSLGYNYFDNPSDNLVFATDLDGKTTVAAQAANTATIKGMLFIASAGNEGGNSWNMVLTPGDADSALTIGSVFASGSMAGNSGYGPNASGKVKPDVCAMGQGAAVFIGSGYGNQSGTSFATPQVAGWAACIWQAQPSATPAQLRYVISRCANSFATPGSHNGYGIPDFSCARQMLLSISEPPGIVPAPWMTIVPNPAASVATLNVVPDTDQYISFSVMDIAGRQVMTFGGNFSKGINPPVSIDVSLLPSGVYFVKAASATHQQVVRLVVD